MFNSVGFELRVFIGITYCKYTRKRNVHSVEETFKMLGRCWVIYRDLFKMMFKLS